MQRREAALLADQLVEQVRSRPAGHALGRIDLARRGRLRAGARRRFGVLPIADFVLQGLLGGNNAGQIDDSRSDRGVGTVLQQFCHHVAAVASGREHQRGLAVCGFPGVGVGLVREQRLDRIHLAGCRRQHERCRPGRRRRVDVRSRIHQRVDDRRRAVLAGEVQRRVAAQPCRRPHVGPGVEQNAGQLGIAVGDRPVQRGHAIALGRVHIGAVAQQRFHR